MTDKDWVKHNLNKWNSIKPYDQIGIVANWLMYENPDVYENIESIDDIFELYKFINIDCDCNFLGEVVEKINNELENNKIDTLRMVDNFNDRIGYMAIDTSMYEY